MKFSFQISWEAQILSFSDSSDGKKLPEMQETRVWSCQEDSLEKGMTTHSSILAWRIPWTEDPGRLQSMGLLRVKQDWSDLAWTHLGTPDNPVFWEGAYWILTIVFLLVIKIIFFKLSLLLMVKRKLRISLEAADLRNAYYVNLLKFLFLV